MKVVIEVTDPNNPIRYEGTEIISKVSEVQKWCILNTEGSEHLFINNTLQSSKADEMIYHEMFVHSLMSGCKNKSSVLILGGSEGCTLREVLKWNVDKVTQVDWDASLVSYFKGDGSSWNSNSYDDPRVTVVISDALEWLHKCNEKYDCILIDLFDPTDVSLGVIEEIIKDCKRCLNPWGSLSVNAGAARSKSANLLALSIKNIFTRGKEFAAVRCSVPSFKEDWVFLMVVSTLWSVIIHEAKLPEMKYYNRNNLLISLQWDKKEYPILNDFWKPKKLTTFGETRISDLKAYYGC